MLETNELEQEIRNRINDVIPNQDLHELKFCAGTETSPEGTYIYAQNDKYHYVVSEKGNIATHKQFDTLDGILWAALYIIIWNISIKYALENKTPDKDFRRALFSKEIELYSKFGEEFGKRKASEIEEILRTAPYHDQNATNGCDCEN